jgi:double-stranded uracil-DNA glycosylase
MLPDLLRSNLKLVICGTAAGTRSAILQEYYAGKGNKFWRTLFEIGLTGEQLLPKQYDKLLEYNIGLTDLVKNKSGMDSTLLRSDYGSESLLIKIKEYKPKILCFNGKRSAEGFLLRSVDYGLQTEVIENTKLFIAPSTSNSANGFWDMSYWKKLTELLV